MKVFVYRNLNRKGVVYSLKAVDGKHRGLVLGYAEEVVVSEPTLKVSEPGRQRVIANKRKNVHAGIVGELLAVGGYVVWLTSRGRDCWQRAWTPAQNWAMLHKESAPIKYNPYENSTFVTKHDGSPVGSGLYATLFQRDVRVFSPRAPAG